MTDQSQTVQQRLSAFLEREARPGQSMESWLFQDFPRGLEQLVRHYDQEGAPYKEECSTLLSDCNLKGMSFSDPRFNEEYSVVSERIMAEAERQSEECYHGNRISFVLTDLNQTKRAYEEIFRQREFFIEKFLPRVKELENGATLVTSDHEFLCQADVAAKELFKLYNRVVADELKPAAGTYAAYKGLVKDLLDRTPKPPDWDARIENQRKNPDNFLPFGKR